MVSSNCFYLIFFIKKSALSTEPVKYLSAECPDYNTNNIE